MGLSLCTSVLPAVVALLSFLPLRAEKLEELKPQGYVNDFAGVIHAQARAQIASLSKEVDEKAHAQLAVVTIRSLEGSTAPEFANRLFKQWGVGYKGDNRGVLILLAVDDRQYWTEVGYSLEPILPDGKVGGFGREIKPLLVQRDYGGALLQMTWRIAEVIARDRGVTLDTQPRGRWMRQPVIPGRLWLVFLLLALFFGGILPFLSLLGGGPRGRGRFGSGGWWMTGGMGGGWGGGAWGGGGSGGAGGFGGFGGGASGGGGAGGSW